MLPDNLAISSWILFFSASDIVMQGKQTSAEYSKEQRKKGRKEERMGGALMHDHRTSLQPRD